METVRGILDRLLWLGFFSAFFVGLFSLLGIGYFLLRTLTNLRPGVKAFGAETIYNPFNALLRSDLLSENGLGFRRKTKLSLFVFLGAVALGLVVVGVIKYRILEENPENEAFYSRVVGVKLKPRSKIVACTTKSAASFDGADFFLFELPMEANISVSSSYPRKAGYQTNHTMIGWHPAPITEDDRRILIPSLDFVVGWLAQSCTWSAVEQLRSLKAMIENPKNNPGTQLAYSYYHPILAETTANKHADVLDLYVFVPGLKWFYVVSYGI